MEELTHTDKIISEPRTKPLNKKTSFIKRMRDDIRSIQQRDPAARGTLEVLINYPGLHAMWGHAMAHWLWTHNLKTAGRLYSQIIRSLTGVEIHPGAIIGSGLFIDHGMGVVIGETAEIGEDVTLYHGVTLGGTSLEKGKRHPTIGDRVVIGAGAKVMGAVFVGDDSRIGANAVVVKSVPENSVVVGVPGQNIRRSHPHSSTDLPDLDHTSLPDVVGITLKQLLSRVEQIEKQIDGDGIDQSELKKPEGEDQWKGEDFSI
ncbi:serine O-acetyltransferase [Chloroflexota bacterium]